MIGKLILLSLCLEMASLGVLSIPLGEIKLSTGPPASISGYINDSVWSQIASSMHNAQSTSNGLACFLGTLHTLSTFCRLVSFILFFIEVFFCIVCFPFGLVSFCFHPFCISQLSRNELDNSLVNISLKVRNFSF